MKESKDVKRVVQAAYADVARGERGCCAPADEGESLANVQFVDYADLRQQSVPDADLGLGCGTPTVWAGLQAGETVLDLGCGAGIDMFLASRSVGPDGLVIGIDLTPEMLALARRNAERNNFTNVRLIRCDLENIPLGTATVDVVLSNCVINLVPEKGRVYRQIHRLLRPGGRFAISDMVTLGQIPEDVRQDPELWTCCIAGALEREVYLQLIRDAGFTDVSVVSESSHEDVEAAIDEGEFHILSVTVTGIKE